MKDDPYEITNLAINPTAEHVKLMHRLNALLLVTKSCNEDSCRKPWPILEQESGGRFRSLDDAMEPRYDGFFASLPQVGFQECLFVQDTQNEIPFFPPEAMFNLGTEYRAATDNYEAHDTKATKTPGNKGRRMGASVQRYATLDDVRKGARNLTDSEIGTVVTCYAPDYCGSITGDGERGTSGGA